MSEENQPKSSLLEEFEELKKEPPAGINSIIQNPLVSQTTLNEILLILIKISKKQEVIGQDLKTQQQSTSELSKKVDEKLQQLSGKIEKLEEDLKNGIEKLDRQVGEKIKVNVYCNITGKTFTTEVKKSDKIKMLESEVFKNFGYKPSKYYHRSQILDYESTFGNSKTIKTFDNFRFDFDSDLSSTVAIEY